MLKFILFYFVSFCFFEAKIAKKLLESLFAIYENKSELSLYLLDLNLDNISYNEKSDKVFFIDAENVILVDKQQIKRSKFGIFIIVNLNLNLFILFVLEN